MPEIWPIFQNVATDSMGNIYILHYVSRTITVLNSTGQFQKRIYLRDFPIAYGSFLPSIHVDLDSYIYVEVSSKNITTFVTKMDQNGNYIWYNGEYNPQAIGGVHTSDTYGGDITLSDYDRTENGIMRTFDGNGTLLSSLRLTNAVFTQFTVDEDGWYYGHGTHVNGSGGIIVSPNGTVTCITNKFGKTISMAVSVNGAREGISMSGSAYTKLYRNGTSEMITNSTGILLPWDIDVVPGTKDSFYIVDRDIQRIVLYNTTSVRIQNVFMAPDRHFPLNSITEDGTFLYLRQSAPMFLKLTITNGELVSSSTLDVSNNGYGLKMHPSNGYLYSINSNCVGSSQQWNWCIVLRDSNLNIVNVFDISSSLGSVTLSPVTFAFDQSSNLYILTPWNNAIIVLASAGQNGNYEYAYSLSLLDIPYASITTPNSIFVAKDSSIFLTVPDSNKVYQLVSNHKLTGVTIASQISLVMNPIAVVVNSNGYVFVNNYTELYVFSLTNTSTIMNSYRMIGYQVDKLEVITVDLWMNAFEDVYIGRCNASALILKNANPPSPSGSIDDENNRHYTGIIIGVVFAVIGFVVVIIMIRLLIQRKHLRSKQSSDRARIMDDSDIENDSATSLEMQE
jgi:hypothetical protein